MLSGRGGAGWAESTRQDGYTFEPPDGFDQRKAALHQGRALDRDLARGLRVEELGPANTELGAVGKPEVDRETSGGGILRDWNLNAASERKTLPLSTRNPGLERPSAFGSDAGGDSERLARVPELDALYSSSFERHKPRWTLGGDVPPALQKAIGLVRRRPTDILALGEDQGPVQRVEKRSIDLRLSPATYCRQEKTESAQHGRREQPRGSTHAF